MVKQYSRDPIVNEVLRNRAEYCEKFHHDLDAIVEDLKKVQAEAAAKGFKVVSLPPKPPLKKPEAA